MDGFDKYSPNGVLFVTSFNKRIFDFTEHHVIKKFQELFGNQRLIAYHENSFEKSAYDQEITEFHLYDRLSPRDLFIENPWLDRFLKSSAFKDCHKSNEYWQRSSPFWFRKVVALCHALKNSKDNQLCVWIDADSCFDKALPAEFFQYLKRHDWLTIFREREWIESGLQFINSSEETRNFADEFLEYYRSGLVFTQEKIWADNWVLGSCFGRNPSITTGGLTKDMGCPIDIHDYYTHSKASLMKVRPHSPDLPKPTRGDRGWPLRRVANRYKNFQND